MPTMVGHPGFLPFLHPFPGSRVFPRVLRVTHPGERPYIVGKGA